MKKAVCCLLCVILVASLAAPAAAALDYTYIDSIYSTIDYDAFWGTVYCAATVESSDDYEMEIEVALQEYNENNGLWTTLKTWSSRGYHWVTVEEYYAVARNKDHRLYVGAFVYDGNGNIIDSGTQVVY